MSEISVGICQCGCGKQTSIAKKTRLRSGHIKGQPLRYIRGHATGRYEEDRTVAAFKALQCRRRYKAESRARAKKLIAEYLKTHPCVDCGNLNPVVLDFDHRNPKEKHKTISQILHGALGIHVLEAEIVKCDVRCANCHRIRHFNQPLRELIGFH
jgi:hypothetical protein